VRHKMPPSVIRFKDKKKEENKKGCRKWLILNDLRARGGRWRVTVRKLLVGFLRTLSREILEKNN
jgi:hypothetical protein